MKRPLRAAVACALLALGLSLLAPAFAAAADAPWVGTYKGVGIGRDKKGKKATSAVTVWVEDLGGSTRFTFRFDKLPVIISRTAPNGGGLNGAQVMRISVNEAGVKGSAVIVVYPKDGNYMMAGKGAGKALGKQGTGRMGAVRTSTGVELPSFAEQVSDLFGALVAGKIKTSSSTSGGSGGSSGLPPSVGTVLSDGDGVVEVASAGISPADDPTEAGQDDPATVIKQAPDVVFVKAVVVEPASITDLAEARPPATTQTMLTVMVLVLVLSGVAALVGVGPRARRTAPAPARADTSGEGGS